MTKAFLRIFISFYKDEEDTLISVIDSNYEFMTDREKSIIDSFIKTYNKNNG